jgi:SAM-dependent methyltransferase
MDAALVASGRGTGMRQKDRYYGDAAQTYDQRRVGKVKWQREHEAVDVLLADLPEGASVLDVPVGTGRFFELYQKHGLQSVGVDVSPDMLELARQRAEELGMEVQLHEASVTDLPLPDGSIDSTVCMRLVYSFTMDELAAVLRELMRVTTGDILLSDRHAFPLKDVPLGGVPRALGRRGKRLATNLQELRAGRRIKRYHRKDALLEVFERVGLEVADRVPIERVEGLQDYGLWVLRRSPS